MFQGAVGETADFFASDAAETAAGAVAGGAVVVIGAVAGAPLIVAAAPFVAAGAAIFSAYEYGEHVAPKIQNLFLSNPATSK